MAVTPRMLTAQPAGEALPPVALDTTYALPSACVVVAARPGQLLRSPAMVMMPTEVLQAAVMTEIGVDPLTTEQIVFTASPPSAGPPTAAAHFTFSAPLNLKMPPLAYPVQEEQLEGRPYLHAQGDPNLPSFWFPDDSSLVVLNDFSAQTFAAKSEAAPDSLLAKFVASDRGDDLHAMVDLEPLRPFINLGLMQAQVPPQFAEFLQVPNLVKTVELRLTFSHPAASELVISANDEAAADSLIGLFNKAKQLMAAQMAAETAQQLASDDPVEQASGRYAQRMAKNWDQLLQLSREGERIVIFRTDPADGPQSQLTQIAVIGVLVALLLPAVQAAREAARRSASLNNLKMLMLAMHNYHDTKGTFPAHANYGPDGNPLLSWRVHLLPYMEQQELYNQFHLDEPWDSEHNKALIAQMPEIYLDPSSPLPLTEGRTNYLGAQGEGRVFDGTPEGRPIKSITDGTSHTIAIVQVDDDNSVIWTRPEDWEMDADDPLAGIGVLHPGVFLAGFCDGRVTAINFDIDPTVFKALVTAAGDEVVTAEP